MSLNQAIETIEIHKHVKFSSRKIEHLVIILVILLYQAMWQRKLSWLISDKKVILYRTKWLEEVFNFPKGLLLELEVLWLQVLHYSAFVVEQT